MGLRAAVLLRPILDPELPAERFGVDPSTHRPPADAPYVLGPFERSALEVALKLKDQGTVDSITVITAGHRGAVEVLRKALAVRCDQAVLIDSDELDTIDPAPRVEVLSQAVEKAGPFDLVFAGRQAGDWDTAQTHFLLAERWGWPVVNMVRTVASAADGLEALHDVVAGVERVAFVPPAVLVVTTDDSNVLRLARVPDLMAASRKPLTTWSPGDLGIVSAAALAQLEVRSVDAVDTRTDCDVIAGDSAEEIVSTLAARLLALLPS